MKYLKKYEDFERQEYTVGDLVKLSNGDVGKIKKISSKYSYILNIMNDTIFSAKPIQVNATDIVGIVQANNTPTNSSDLMNRTQSNPSNDLVINGGFPEIPMANVMSR